LERFSIVPGLSIDSPKVADMDVLPAPSTPEKRLHASQTSIGGRTRIVYDIFCDRPPSPLLRPSRLSGAVSTIDCSAASSGLASGTSGPRPACCRPSPVEPVSVGQGLEAIGPARSKCDSKVERITISKRFTDCMTNFEPF
jgi:hypothetical protein